MNQLHCNESNELHESHGFVCIVTRGREQSNLAADLGGDAARVPADAATGVARRTRMATPVSFSRFKHFDRIPLCEFAAVFDSISGCPRRV